MEIKNFILMRWGNDAVKQAVPDSELCNRMIWQLRRFHPEATIHFLTNQVIANSKVNIHYEPKLDRSHLAKFRIFSLLEEPAMYLDTDIILIKPFLSNHIETYNPIQLYRWYPWPPFGHLYRHYNAGIIWVREPRAGLENEIIKIHRSFNNPSFNEEYAISKFINIYKMEMYPNSDVGQLAHAAGNIRNFQSIHYAGWDNKKLYMEHFNSLYGKEYAAARTILVL